MKFNPRTYSWRTILLSCECLPESQCNWNFDLRKFFQQSQHSSIHNSPVICWNICRRSKFPSHWLSGRLLYQRMTMRKLEVLGLSFPCFPPLESGSSKIAHFFLTMCRGLNVKICPIKYTCIDVSMTHFVFPNILIWVTL